MKDSQTPHKDHSNSSDLINRKSHLKKPQKIPKKSLNGLFTSVSDNIIAPDRSDHSPVSQITEVSASSEIFSPAEVTPISKSAAESNADVAVERFDFNNVEADVVVSLLKKAWTDLTNSADVDFKSKKVLGGLTDFVINEYKSCPGEKEQCTEFVSEKFRVVALCFAIWFFAVLGILFFNKGMDDYSYNGLVPT